MFTGVPRRWSTFFMILQEEEPEMFERQPSPRGVASLSIRARSAFLRCAHRPAAPPSTRARLSPAFSMLASTLLMTIDRVPVFVLCGRVRANVRRTLPRHAGEAAAARRGERRRAAVARSGQVDGGAAGAVSSRARPPPSGRSRARSVGRGASPRADRRSCAPSCARRCAGDAAARRGWAPLCWDVRLCAYGVARHPYGAHDASCGRVTCL